MGFTEGLRDKQRVLALVSGSASTAYNIHLATTDGRLPNTELVGVITSNAEAGSSFRKNNLDLPPVRVIEVARETFDDAYHYGEALIEAIKRFQPDVIGQYGHTPLTPMNTLDFFSDQFWINQHGGPLNPDQWDFGGKGMSCAARYHAARLMFVRATERNYWTDVSAQRVGVNFDEGPVIKRGRVEICDTDTVTSLTDKAIKVEWQVQIDTLKDLEKGRVTELPPYLDLVLPGERSTLELAKELGVLLYTPHGELRKLNLSRIINEKNQRLSAESHRLLDFLKP